MIDFHLSPIGTNSQNVRVSQIESAIYKGDVIAEEVHRPSNGNRYPDINIINLANK